MTEIESVSIIVSNLAESARFFGQTLELATVLDGSSTKITIGSSALLLTEGPSTSAVHHLAFEIADTEFDTAHSWLRARVELLRSEDGKEVVEGPSGWNSRSLYFAGPDHMILELIARRRRTNVASATPFDGLHLVNINEVGIGVDDVPRSAREASAATGWKSFGSTSTSFHPVGSDSGLLIFVTAGRSWTPDHQHVSGRLPVTVQLRSGTSAQTLNFT